MRQPYVVTKVSKRTGQPRYTGMYWDATAKPRSAGTYDDELEALTAARREQDERDADSLDSMTLAQKRAVTFEAFWPIFQRHHRVEPNTMQTYFGNWINHIRPYLRKHRIATFSSTEAVQYFTALDDAGTTVNNRKACRTVLSAMIKLSVTMKYRTDNPIRGLNVGKQAAHKSIKVINETVFWELCEELPLPTQKLFAEYIISTGVRFCEAISFEEGDLDYETCMLTVCRSTVEVARQFHPTGGRFVTRPYTKNGEHRRFKLGRPLVEKIRAHVIEHGLQPGDLIFPIRLFMPATAWVNLPRCTEEEMLAAAQTTFISAVTGNRVTHAKVSTYVKHKCRCGPCVQTYRDYRSAYRVQKMARRGKTTRQRVRRDSNDYMASSEWSNIWIPARRKIGVDITPYQLRHSHASLLLANGVPLPDVQARLGHNDLSSTTHYVWALAEESDTAANAMDVLLGYKQKEPGAQEAMMAQMAAMMERMESMMGPALIREMAGERLAPRPGLHLVTDAVNAIDS
ncbi:tyrosine-type recombinase/integrase [Actinomadura hibisca]|uniref:tyrosine-type recombinase/integrase n=1 Tax=Actinomadura hibisca TaxID=68565 RepID=UPI00082B0DD9|nr:tyrosine-type recombinase/integrase [Actinomadura hibisca]